MEVTKRKAFLNTGDMLGNYRIVGFLGQGGFGVTYLALDTKLDLQVAIKEYLPESIATRGSDNSIQPNSPKDDSLFSWGLSRFTKEAQTLAKFNHPNIVRVMAILELNGTAYMVMEYEQGKELKHLFSHPENCDEASLKRIVGPIIDGLSEVHRHGYIHRDIKPANILVRDNGTPVLLDFGSARQSNADQTRALTALVSVGYAPLEQYNESGDKQQGPWTDIYALAAVLYFTITGKPPIDSTLRGSAVLNDRPDPLVPLQVLQPERYSISFCRAIDWALSFKISHRPQNLGEWRAQLLAGDNTVFMPRRTGRSSSQTVISDRTTNGDLPHIANRSSKRPSEYYPESHRSDKRHSSENSFTDSKSRAPTHSVQAGSSQPAAHISSADSDLHSHNADREFTSAHLHLKTPLIDEQPWDTARPAEQREARHEENKGGSRWWRLPLVACLLIGIAGSLFWKGQWGSVDQTLNKGVSSTAETGEGISQLGLGSETGVAAHGTAVEQAAVVAQEKAELDAARQADERWQLAQRQAELEAARRVESERQQAEADARVQEELRKVEAARQSELLREQEAEALRQAELKRLQELEVARQAELKSQQEAELRRLAEQQAEKDAEVARLAAWQKEQAASALRNIELKRQQEEAEAERLAELEAAREARARPITEDEMSRVLGQFNNLTKAIKSKDLPEVQALTVESDRKYRYLEYIFRTFERIDVAMVDIRASRMEQKISGTLHIRQMHRSNGDTAFPPKEFQRIPVHIISNEQWSIINW